MDVFLRPKFTYDRNHSFPMETPCKSKTFQVYLSVKSEEQPVHGILLNPKIWTIFTFEIILCSIFISITPSVVPVLTGWTRRSQ